MQGWDIGIDYAVRRLWTCKTAQCFVGYTVCFQAAEKKKDVKDYAVGKNPEHPSTRCFFAVKEDGSKVDDA